MDVKEVCLQIENDEFYSKFLGDNVNPIISDKLSVTDQVSKLTEGIQQLNAQLEKQVLLKHNDLLTQASHVTDLENALAKVQHHVQILKSGAEKLKAKVHVPFNVLETNARTLERVQRTCHLLRHVAKIIALSKVLMLVENEPSKEASILFELNELLGDDDFDGIDILKDKINLIQSRRRELLKKTNEILEKSLLVNQKVELLKCFKVFQNLQCTNEQIDRIVSDILSKILINVNNAVNIQLSQEAKRSSQSRHAPGKVNIMSSQEIKQKLWENIEKTFNNEIYEGCSKIIMLQSALNELHTIGNFNSITRTFWDNFSQSFSSEITKSPVAISQCIEIDYPKLLKCFNDLLSKLKHKDFVLKREALSRWENAFLSKSLGKLLEPVRSMWQPGSAPTTDALDMSIRTISSTLSVSGDKQLSISLAQSVAKCIKQMNAEAEQRMCVDGDLAQIIEAPTSSQQKNAELCNALNYFASQINRVLNNMSSILTKESIEIVQESLKIITSAPVLQPLAVSICKSLDIILLTMHDEPDLARNDDPSGKPLTCSAYMKELQQFLLRCRDIYLSMFDDSIAVEECCSNIASHCIERFIWQVCNVRPLTKFGRVKLRLDCERLETALQPLVSDLSKLGDYTRWFKAIHIILGLSYNEILQSQLEGGALPFSLVMMYLFSFAQKELVSPGAAAGWNIQKLISWLDSHRSEKDRLELVSGALKRYQHYVRTHNVTVYDPVYPILVQLLDEGKKKCV